MIGNFDRETHEVVIQAPDGAFFLGDGHWDSEREIPEEIPVHFAGGEAAILGDRDDEVPIVIEFGDSAPDAGDLGDWHTVVEGSLMLPEGHLPIRTATQDFDVPLVAGPGLYRVRIHARSTGPQRGPENARGSRHRVSLWPVAGTNEYPVAVLKGQIALVA